MDLFLYICKDLKSDYDQSRNSCRLSMGSLTVTLDVTIDKFDLHEVLEIRKKWDLSAGEYIVYTMDYIEPHIYEAHERARMKSDPGEDWIYQAHLKAENKNRYLSKEMFIDNLTITEAPDCGLEYATDNLGRGLRTLAHLKLSAEQAPDGRFVDVLFPVYTEMLIAADDYLKEQLGEDKTHWTAALRAGRTDIQIPFGHRVKKVDAPWFHGHDLVRVCRYYAKTEVH